MKGTVKRFLKGFYITYLACLILALLVGSGLLVFKKSELELEFWDIAMIGNFVGAVFGLLGGLANVLEIRIHKG